MATSYRAIAEPTVAARIPELSFSSIRSTELTACLDRVAAGHTVLLCGPAGIGKTVALVDWVRRSRRTRAATVGWLTVTEQLAAGALLPAIARALDRRGDPVVDGALCTPADQAADLVAALTDAEPVILVLDDAHLITDPLQLAGLEHLLTHLPASVTVLIAARFDPPLRWHALELDGRLTRCGAAELALSPERIARLFAQHGCRLDDTELAVVHTLTRGWAALVRIAAIYLAAHPDDRDTALTALARPSHAVADFLVAELMAALPARTLDFLLVTAIPERFCLPLAEELVGGDAARIVDELLRANFPLHTVADNGELWHTYHPLLRAYLQAEAAHSGADRLPDLHRRIAAWFAAAAQPGRALDHVLAEPGTPHLDAFLRDWGMRLVLDGSGHRLLAAVEHLPDLADDTFVRLLRAAVAVEAGEIAAAEVYLESAHVGSDQASRLVPAAWTAALDHAVSAGLAVLVGDSASTRWPLPAATGQPDLDCYAALHCGYAEVARTEADGGVAALRHALVHAEEAGLGRTAVRARTALAVAAGYAGQVGEQRSLAEAALDCADRYGLAGAAEAVFAGVIGAYAAHQRGTATSRQAGVLPGATEFEISVPAPVCQAAIIAGIVAFETAPDRAAAATTLGRQLHRLIEESPVLPGTDALVPDVLWPLLRVQAKTDAQQLVEHAVRVLGETPETLVAAAGLALWTQRPTAALALLEPLLARGPRWHSGHAVTAWLVVAVAADRLDRPRKVDDAFGHAMALASGDQLVRPFLDVPGAAELLDRLGGSFGRFDAFADLVRAHRGTASDAPSLTGTEFAVLRQLPSGMTASTIATGMGVSVNTVKTHLRGIYQKLGVSTRADAIAAARRFGLI